MFPALIKKTLLAPSQTLFTKSVSNFAPGVNRFIPGYMTLTFSRSQMYQKHNLQMVATYIKDNEQYALCDQCV